MIKNLPVNAGHSGDRFDPWVWKVPCRRKGNLLQYSCLENSMARGTCLKLDRITSFLLAWMPSLENRDRNAVGWVLFFFLIWLHWVLVVTHRIFPAGSFVQDISLQWMGSRACGLGFCSLQA